MLDNSERTHVKLKTLLGMAQATRVGLKKSFSISQQTGDYLSVIKGRGMEFDETRLYQPGDDISSLDWRVTARTGKAHTKIYREERERPVFIAVDYRTTMHFATRGVFKNVLAAKIAALLAWIAQRQCDRIGGQIFSEHSSHELRPINGKRGVLLLLHQLVARQKPQTSNNLQLQHAMWRLSNHVRPSSLVCIISDFRGLNVSVEHTLAKLSRHCTVMLINIYDPLERQLPEQGRYQLTNGQHDVILDTKDKNRVGRYLECCKQRQQHLSNFALKYKMILHNYSTDSNIRDVLQQIR